MSGHRRLVGLCAALVLLEAGGIIQVLADESGNKDYDESFGMLEQMQNRRFKTQADVYCTKVASSKAFQNWLEAYNKKDYKKAEQHWCEVMHQLKEMGSIDCARMLMIADERTMFHEQSTGDPLLWHRLLDATKKCLGPHDPYVATCSRYVARLLEGKRDYSAALAYRKTELAILQEQRHKDEKLIERAERQIRYDSFELQKRKPKTK